MRSAVWTSVALALIFSSPANADRVLGADNKAGLWEDQLHSNLDLMLNPDITTGKLSAAQIKQASDVMMAKRDSVRRICGTQEQAQHPRQLAGAADFCTPGLVTTSGQTALFDVTCSAKSKYHVAIEFDTPTHARITLTEIAPSIGRTNLVTVHDLHWLSPDCGDLKPGQMRETVPPSFLTKP